MHLGFVKYATWIMMNVIIDLFSLYYFSSMFTFQNENNRQIRLDRKYENITYCDTLIVGRWVVEKSTLPSINIPSFCSDIRKDAVFVFSGSDSLHIFSNGKLKACGVYTYIIQDDIIQIMKADMVMLVNYKLVNEKLVLKSKAFFRWNTEDVQDTLLYKSLLIDGVTLSLKRAGD